jgi:hypothetical protein
MELKHVNPKCDNVVANNPNNVEFCFWKIVNTKFGNEPQMLYFLQNNLTTCKTKLLIIFTSLIIIK